MTARWDPDPSCGARPPKVPGVRHRLPCIRSAHGAEVKHRAYGGREWTDAETVAAEEHART